jgi:hypothetical protein
MVLASPLDPPIQEDKARGLVRHFLLNPMPAGQGGDFHIWNDRGQGFGSGDHVLISVDHKNG